MSDTEKNTNENSPPKEDMNYYFKIWLKKTVSNVR